MLFLSNDHSDSGPAPYGEPHFSYLNRSGRSDVARVREIAEDWFSRYPNDHKEELRSRFQSSDDINFLSSFFELFLHELLFRFGYSVTVHPNLPSGSSKRPDFFVRSAREDGFYLEAVMALSKSAKQLAADRRLDVLYNTINGIESPNFFIGIKMKRAPDTPPPGGKIRAFLGKQLQCLDPDDYSNWTESGGFDCLPTWEFSHDGWHVEFFAIPKSKSLRGNTDVRPLSMQMPMEARFIDTRTPIRDAITQKAGRYGRFDCPFIVAVNALDPFVDDDDVMEALFGSEQVMFSVTDPTSSTRTLRAPDGAWISKTGPRNTRISAAMVCTSIYPWSVARNNNTSLYHNPWARHPYRGQLNQLRHAKPAGNLMEWVEGAEPRVLFGLPKGWPKCSSDSVSD